MKIKAVVVARDGKLHMSEPDKKDEYRFTLCGLRSGWPGLAVTDFDAAVIATTGALCKSCLRVVGGTAFKLRTQIEKIVEEAEL